MKNFRGYGFRAIEGLGLLRSEGFGGVGRRVVRRAYDRMGAADLEFPLLAGDLADSAHLHHAAPESCPAEGTPLRVGWLCTPPGAGSGGHTTMFRMVEALERRGHTCVVYLYDRYGGHVTRHAEVIRRAWPNVRAEIRSVSDGMSALDACVSTSWQTAHVLASRPALRSRRLYFIQDFEPMFYPRGSLYELATDSYRFGFRNIALGSMVAGELQALGAPATMVPFGCDTKVYSLSNHGQRSGVVFYAKPTVDRRGFLLAELALRIFHSRYPEHQIHVYGDTVGDLAAPVIRHHQLSPAGLNELYNRTIGGLAMSFTNISLVAEELLAAGNIPVVNDSPLSRADLPNPHVAWASPTPTGIADALSRIVEAADIPGRAGAAAASVRRGWDQTSSRVARIVEGEVYGQVPAGATALNPAGYAQN